MRTLKKIGAMMAVAAAAGTVGVPAAADTQTPGAGGSRQSDIVTLDLYNLTDIHGHIEPVFDKYTSEAGLSHMACYLNKARKANPDSQFTLLGDNIGASPFTSGTQNDNPTVEALNKMGVFASTIGNHEFDKGLDVLKARIDGSDPTHYAKINFPYLGANISGMGTYLKNYRMWQSPSGVKVAFIGAIEDDVATKLFPGTVDSLTFAKPVPVINDLARELKTVGGYVTGADGSTGTEKVKADVVIAMFDNDVERSYPQMGKYVDGLMGGDTHKPYYFTKVRGAEGNILSAVASGSFTDNLANLQLKYDRKAGKVVDSAAVRIPAAEVKKCGDDPQVKAVTDAAAAKSESIKNTVITSKAGKFYRASQEDANHVKGENRGAESTLGGLIGDVMKNSFRTLDNRPIDIGVVVAGDIRSDLATDSGKITVGDVFKVMPWSNEINYVTMTGAQFQKLLEQQWKELDAKSSRPMLKLNFSSNVKYTYDPARERGQRITSVLIDGKLIDPQAKYTVAGSSFLLSGGDSFTVFGDPEVKASKRTVPNRLDREWFGQYLEKNQNVQPRKAKSSVGVSVKEEPLKDGMVKAKVSLRGLSFSGVGEPRVEKVTVKFGANSVTASVNNTLYDPNAAQYSAIVTADGIGHTDTAADVSARVRCSGRAGQTVHIPLTVENEAGTELVGAVQGLGVDVTCPAADGSVAGGGAEVSGVAGGGAPGEGASVSADKTPVKVNRLVRTGAGVSAILILSAGMLGMGLSLRKRKIG